MREVKDVAILMSRDWWKKDVVSAAECQDITDHLKPSASEKGSRHQAPRVVPAQEFSEVQFHTPEPNVHCWQKAMTCMLQSLAR